MLTNNLEEQRDFARTIQFTLSVVERVRHIDIRKETQAVFDMKDDGSSWIYKARDSPSKFRDQAREAFLYHKQARAERARLKAALDEVIAKRYALLDQSYYVVPEWENTPWLAKRTIDYIVQQPLMPREV